MDTRQMLREERAELVSLLRTLSDAEWEAPSLCTGWRVRDVVAHLQTDTVSLSSYTGLLVRGRFSVDRVNDLLVRKMAPLPPATLTDRLAGPEGWFSRMSPGLALADTFVHQQDIRRPLGRERKVPAERLRAVLSHPDPFAFPRRYTRGLHFTATDLDWTQGAGPEVRGPAEALALAMVGRPAALADLDGDGVPLLRERLA
ncbi:maleylpyruvate isomerase family mycothiol-dependent enzyme [Nocardia wallacei]|uniref:maleylpyruvate isomerase family mycothiol-dependent enzyme n=1 Tax=Nocardia wallacei TaxID=480035 RepID=UPI00245580BA|nr:maleylpyruvate isomerase family mycothiol-dependent enzyme [Nocardia wallacei]